MTLADDIRFGTDGWRAVLGEGFTTDRFVLAIRATAATPPFAAARDAGIPIMIGFDTRLLADRFAALAAAELADLGFSVVLADAPAATPAVCAAVVDRGAAAGLMITASHNPPDYLGLKIKGPWGGSATPDWIAAIEAALPTVDAPQALVPFRDCPAATPRGDFVSEHAARMRRFVTPTAGALTIVHDAMYGSGAGLAATMLAGSGSTVVPVRHERNPGFGGHGPEPIESRLAPMVEAVRASGADFGFATDGDADRIAACDADGRFVYPHEIFALNLLYLAEVRGLRGRVVRSISTGELVRKVAEAFDCPVTTVPVGFKHTVGEMLAGGVIIGGEESGGIAVVGHLPERDGVLNGLLLRELMLARGQSLREILDDLDARFGPSAFARRDLHVPADQMQSIVACLQGEAPAALAGHPVTTVDRLDGTKIWCGAERWILVRASGTEPILRVYAEAPTMAEVEALHDALAAWLA